jgi:hypothetical protein
MKYLKYKLIGKEVFVKDNYAYFDLNGAISTESINEIIQEEIWGKITDQFYFPMGGGPAGANGEITGPTGNRDVQGESDGDDEADGTSTDTDNSVDEGSTGDEGEDGGTAGDNDNEEIVGNEGPSVNNGDAGGSEEGYSTNENAVAVDSGQDGSGDGGSTDSSGNNNSGNEELSQVSNDEDNVSAGSNSYN